MKRVVKLGAARPGGSSPGVPISPGPAATEAALFNILPHDGASITNRAARALLAHRLGRAVTNDEYFLLRDALLAQRLIGRVRGQGGSIFRLTEDLRASQDVSAEAPIDELPASSGLGSDATDDGGKVIPERELMFPAQRALIKFFPGELDLPEGSPDPILEDISTTGPKSGIWARPDFVMVCVSRFSVLPGMHVETHVFELKNETGGGMKAVHEALAQSRFANYAHLVWHVPDGSPRAAEISGIAEHCTLHGVGLIRLRLTENRDATLEVLVDARRTPTSALEIDGFLEARLSDAGREQLAAALRSSAVA